MKRIAFALLFLSPPPPSPRSSAPRSPVVSPIPAAPSSQRPHRRRQHGHRVKDQQPNRKCRRLHRALPAAGQIHRHGHRSRLQKSTAMTASHCKTGDNVDEDSVLTVGSVDQEVHVTARHSAHRDATATSGQVLTAEEIEDLPRQRPFAARPSPSRVRRRRQAEELRRLRPALSTTPRPATSRSAAATRSPTSTSSTAFPTCRTPAAYPASAPYRTPCRRSASTSSNPTPLGDTSGGTVNLITKAGTNQLPRRAHRVQPVLRHQRSQRWFSQRIHAGHPPEPVRRLHWRPGLDPEDLQRHRQALLPLLLEGFKGSTPDPRPPPSPPSPSAPETSPRCSLWAPQSPARAAR